MNAKLKKIETKRTLLMTHIIIDCCCCCYRFFSFVSNFSRMKLCILEWPSILGIKNYQRLPKFEHIFKFEKLNGIFFIWNRFLEKCLSQHKPKNSVMEIMFQKNYKNFGILRKNILEYNEFNKILWNYWLSIL